MAEDIKMHELEKAQIKTESHIQFLSEKMAELAEGLKELKLANQTLQNINQQQSGVIKILGYVLLPLIGCFIAMGGYVKQNYDKDLTNVWSHVDALETNQTAIIERLTKSEYAIGNAHDGKVIAEYRTKNAKEY